MGRVPISISLPADLSKIQVFENDYFEEKKYFTERTGFDHVAARITALYQCHAVFHPLKQNADFS